MLRQSARSNLQVYGVKKARRVIFKFAYLTTLPVSILNSVDNNISKDCGAFGVMKIGNRTRRTRRKPAPVPLYPPKIPRGTWDRTLVATAGSWRLRA
jgi:hypothetical protein